MEQNQQNSGVKLFNGVPEINVKLGRDGIFRWAVNRHGAMETASKQFLIDYCTKYGFKANIQKESGLLKLVKN